MDCFRLSARSIFAWARRRRGAGMDDRDLGGLLDLAYGAAADASLWPGFLNAFADAMRADASALVWQDQRTRQGRGLGARLDPTVLPLYFDAFATRHPSQRW